MTMLREDVRPAGVEEPTRGHAFEWVVGIVAGLMAALGAWMRYGPSDGVLTIFTWDLDVGDLHEAWPLSLLVIGGVGLCVAFGVLARKLYRHDMHMSPKVWSSVVLAVAGLALAAAFTWIWVV